jgi:glycopeptide antibiotics resistance protein
MRNVKLVLLVLYVIVLLWVLLFKFSFSLQVVIEHVTVVENERHINLVPLASSGGRREILMNVLAFVPFGTVLAMSLRSVSVLTKVLCVVLFSLLIEILQYILNLGVSDITDLLTNSFGGVIGIVFCQILSSKFHQTAVDSVLVLVGYGLLLIFILFFAYLFFIMRVHLNFL